MLASLVGGRETEMNHEQVIMPYTYIALIDMIKTMDQFMLAKPKYQRLCSALSLFIQGEERFSEPDFN